MSKMKLIQLAAENVMGLKAIEITPDGHVLEIAGENGAGKSSVLNLIAFLLAGKSAIPKEPLRRGAEKGWASLTLDGDVPKGKPPLKVHGTFGANGRTALKITDVEGNRLPSPQTVLEALWNRVAFDPEAFRRQTSKQQEETLKTLAGLDFTDLDDKRATLYAERTNVNRDVHSMRTRLDAMPTFDDAPKGEVSVADLAGELKRRVQVNQHNTTILTEHDAAGKQQLRLREDVAELERRLAEANDLANAHDVTVEGLHVRMEALVDKDCEEIESQITTAEETNRRVRANAAVTELCDERWERVRAAEALTTRIEAIDKKKADTVAAAEMPLDGLGFDEDGVTYNDIPLAQVSAGEAIDISVAIGFALNPDLPIVLLREGSLLGDAKRAHVYRAAEKCDGLLVIELVGAGGENSVVIEDGHVREPEPVVVT